MRLARARDLFYCDVVVHSCAAHGVRNDPCLDTVHDVLCLHARCIQLASLCIVGHTTVYMRSLHAGMEPSPAPCHCAVNTNIRIVCPTTHGPGCIQRAAHSIWFAQNTYAWGSFDALRSGVMNMHATPLRFAESKSGWEGYFQSAIGSW